ncbi:MAG TPA: hypothetical protein ENO05_03170 [Bacteroides sp.]|nr:hypothetical protein [Bacteroides sp.]
MRTVSIVLGLMILLFTGIQEMNADNGEGEQGNPVRVVASPDLERLTGTWIEAYNSTSPATPVTYQVLDGGRMNEVIREKGTIVLLSQKDLAAIPHQDTWHILVGRDVIVPVMNRENPYRDQLVSQGISPEAFSRVYTAPEVPTWGMVLGNEVSRPLHPYAFGSKTCLAYLAGFMNTQPKNLTASAVGSKDEMLSKIRQDRYAIGFCRLSEMARAESEAAGCDLCLIPVDLNGNMRIDNFEHIYDCTGDLARGIWIGKYPDALCNQLYMVSGEEPTGDTEVAFLEWVVTEGQRYLATSDYSQIVSSEQLSNIERIRAEEAPLIRVPVKSRPAGILLFAAGALLAAVLIFLLGIRFASRRQAEPAAGRKTASYISDAGEVAVPGGMFFDKSHTWAFMEKEGLVRVGIDDFLQHIVGKITRVEMKRTGEQVKKGEVFMTLVQQGKKLDIQSPVSGVIKASNSQLALNPGLLNSAPYSGGWLYEIEPSGWLKEIRAFLMGDHYREWIRTEFDRLKEFLTSGLKGQEQPLEHPVLQEGGAIRDGVMECFGPEAWEEFQSGFISRHG